MKTKSNNTFSLPEVKSIFVKYNKLYFGGILPIPTFTTDNSIRTVACFKAFKSKSTGILFDSTIVVSKAFDFSNKAKLEDIILHEMIHYYIAYMDIKDNNIHGYYFQGEMKRLNKLGKHNIEIYDTTLPLFNKKESNIILFPLKGEEKYRLVKVGKNYRDYYINHLNTWFQGQIDTERAAFLVVTDSDDYARLKTNQNGSKFSYKSIEEYELNELTNFVKNQVSIVDLA